MKLRYLLDTNVLSEPARPKPNDGIMKKLGKHRGEMATAALVWHEAVFGARLVPSSRKRHALERYLYNVVRRNLPILPYGRAAAEWHASERARLEREGKTPPFIDGQIAAIAKVNDLEIITTNTRDYIAFKGIRVADWRS